LLVLKENYEFLSFPDHDKIQTKTKPLIILAVRLFCPCV